MAVQQVVLFLALASLLVADAAEYDTSAMFLKWLDRQTSPKVQIAAISTQEEEVKTTTACLQEVGHRNCRCLQPNLIDQTEVCTRAYTE